MQVHHVADDERRAFVAAQNAGRERPGDLELLDVLSGDLVELGVPVVHIVTGLDAPLLGVLDDGGHALIGEDRHRDDGGAHQARRDCDIAHS